MHGRMQRIEKPIILAIVGKSCAGKDTLARWLCKHFQHIGLPTHRLISCTTRPPRVGENETDYYFMTEDLFKRNARQRRFFETTKFRNWHYGLLKDEIKPGVINIGVFDLKGIEHLAAHKFDYTIVPIYIKQDFFVRLKRSHDREGKWKLEHFRRVFADDFHFRDAEKKISCFNGQKIVLDRIDGVWNSTLIVQDRLERFRVLRRNDEGRLRLGNFV